MNRSLKITTGLALVLALAPWAAGSGSALAQDARCFPETNQCISGRFRQFWEQNGGLAVFGFPIGPAHDETNPDDSRTHLTQWFERNRFELHQENQPPYDVLLGRLGAPDAANADSIARQPESGPHPSCLWFAQTGFNVCNTQVAQFASYWQSHGLADPSMIGYQRSLALFGLPLSRQISTGAADTPYIQYFERARFEWHPSNPDPYKVLLGRLGAEANPPSTAPAAYANTDTSVDLLASYYNAINRQDYQRAYGYWESPPSGYDDFVRGYADTAAVQLIVRPPTFIDAGAGNLHTQVPTVLIAQRRDGGTQIFSGCYTAHKSNLHPPDIPREDIWHLSQATIAVAPADAAIPSLLAQACPDLQPPAYVNTSSPLDMLASFYDAINRQDYQRAYGYWESPPSGYGEFAQGYADTAAVQLIVQPPAFLGAAAGSSYASISTALVATHRDGSQQIFSGCYTARKSNLRPPDIPREDTWPLYSAAITPAPAGAGLPALLAHACPAN
jgi:hypothetical protein